VIFSDAGLRLEIKFEKTDSALARALVRNHFESTKCLVMAFEGGLK